MRYGEFPHDIGSFDYYPEVFVGRVLAYTDPEDGDPNEVTNWINKVLNYEKNPGNSSGLTRVFFSTARKADNYDIDFQRYVRLSAPHYPLNFFCDTPVGLMPSATRDRINDPFGTGWGWVNIFAHGEAAHWAPYYRDAHFFYSPTYPNEVDLNELTNTNRYFIVWSGACNNAAFDWAAEVPIYTDTTVCEGFLEAYPNKGAVAFFGNTRAPASPGSAFNFYPYLLDCIFTDGRVNYLLGPALAWMKYDRFDPYNYYTGQGFVYFHNLFGSPLTEVWTNVPVQTTTTVSPNRIPVNQTRTVTVTVRYFNGETYVPLSNARVTLYGCAIYRIGYTNAQGQVSFTITPTETGTIKATATKHDYKPSQANIYVGLKSEVASDVNLPPEFFMALSSSNPVKGNLKLQYGIPVEDEGPVSLKIYDVSGRSIKTVFSEEKSAGYYDLSIPTSSFSSGTYFLRLEARNKTKTEKVVIR